ncbi:hypothetical protein ACFPC0_11195 [Streptomyces andamanensis]|uniref:Uncharacterized protein n=1 Tax=Streptomyces andamanensis TaxID=1565035 RepID=A0ABV8TCR1_9ACTN
MKTPPALVNWPHDDPAYHDSGEGGLFAYVAIPDPGTPDECCVDVSVHMTAPDAAVTREPALWEPFDYHACGSTRLHRVRARLEQLQEGELAKSMDNLMGRDELSLALRGAVFIGSTHASLVADHGYFQVTKEHLTPDGLRLYDSLTVAFGSEPAIVTFLDT